MFFLSSSTICAIFVYFSLVTSVGRTLQLNKMYFFLLLLAHAQQLEKIRLQMLSLTLNNVWFLLFAMWIFYRFRFVFFFIRWELWQIREKIHQLYCVLETEIVRDLAKSWKQFILKRFKRKPTPEWVSSKSQNWVIITQHK